MSEEMAERLLAVLERIAVQLEQRPVALGPHPGVWGHISAPPQLPQFYPMTPVVACNCPPNHICMSVSCPRGLRSATAQVSDATQQYHYQSDGVTSAVATTQE